MSGMSDRLGVIIVAAGSGIRMNGIDKLFTPIGGTAVLARAIAPFQQSKLVDSIVKLPVEPQVFRNRREQVVDVADADRLQHLRAVLRA